LGSGFLKDMK